ncbi:MAG: S8 family serine peptidase [Bacteroidales bacterium]|nr:S8 family serine peptidase [Bacteroidales bacterium]
MKNTSLCLTAMTMLLLGACAKPELSGTAAEDNGYKGPSVEQEISPEQMEQVMFLPGKAIVKLSEEMALAVEKGVQTKALAGTAELLGVSSMERVFPDAGEFEIRTRREGLHRFYLVEFDETISYSEAKKLLESAEGVENVDPCRREKSMDFDDPYLSRLWGFVGNYNIHVQEAWDYCVGDPNVVVCVVDQGVQQDHDDLKWNLYGDNYNFVKKNTTINAGDHGTHVSGTIAGVSNNGIGVAGIAGGDYKAGKRGVSIQSAQVFDGNRSASSFASAIKWGADHGAVISQNSWGNNYDWNNDGKLTGSELEYALNDRIDATTAAAIDYFNKYAGCDNDGNQLPGSPMKGGIVVFAAGNDGISNGVPAHYEGCVAVGAVASSGSVTSFSNYGDWVDICAPGQSIYSTISGNTVGQMSGTSMACPHVSGACALLVSFFGGEGFTSELLREILINGATENYIKYNAHPVGPYLNVYASLQYGIDKLKRENNNDPVITTDYEGDFVFRQYQRTITVPFHISDPDGDKVSVTAELEGRGTFEQDPNDPEIWNFTILSELVSDFTPKKAKITAKDLYGGVAEYEFSYQVLKNNAPVAIGKIDDVIIIGTDKNYDINLSGLFKDDDGEQLELSVKDQAGAPAVLRLNGEKLTIDANSYGSSTVSVSAVDGMKEKATIKFNYLVRARDVQMDFYPNPVVDILHVRTGLVEEETRIVLENPAGSIVYDETVACSAFHPAEVKMKNFAPGVYTLRVEFGGQSYVNNVAKR